MTFLCSQQPARVSGTSAVAGTVARGIFVGWVGFFLFQKQRSAGNGSVQGGAVSAELAVRRICAVKVARPPGGLFNGVRTQEGVHSEFNSLACSQELSRQPSGLYHGPPPPSGFHVIFPL